MTIRNVARSGLPRPGRSPGPRAARDPAADNRPATSHPAADCLTARHSTAGHPAADCPTARHSTAGQASRGRAAVVPVLARRARPVALAVGGFLLPWCVLLGLTLPVTAQAQHWSLAWAGLDGAEALAALATAVLLGRADPRAALAAAAGGTLLLTDAWFDVCTSAPGLDHAFAVAEAACLELPLPAAAFWLAFSLTRRTPAGQQDHRSEPAVRPAVSDR